MASQQITKRLICGWKGCDDVFEEAAAFKEHVDKHFHEYMQTDLDKQAKDGTEEEQQQDEPLALAKVNEDKTANGVDIGTGKRKVVFLAVEIWTDILGFVKRIQLARTVSLTNLQIYQICWPRLHGNKVEAHQIRCISIIGQERSDQDHRQALVLKNHDDEAIAMPSCPLPSYITGFGEITINFLDQQVLAFFTRILPCLAKDGVSIHLDFDGSNAKQCALLDQLLNKFRDGLPTDKLHAICCPLSDIQYLPNIDNKMKMIDLYFEQTSDIPNLMKMLASPRPDGQQRVIHVFGQEEDLMSELIRTIQEDFCASTQRLAQPFYICFRHFDLDVQVESVETNKRTGEQLTIMPVPTPPTDDDDDLYNLWEICRHPLEQHERLAEDGRKRVEELAFLSYDERDHSPIWVDLE